MIKSFKNSEISAVNPEQQISQLPLLTQTERHQLLFEWNHTFAEYPQDKCIHQLFEEQVELNPDVVAVVFEGEQLTYRELNQRANQLAHYLQSLGVGPEVLVGICVERSFEMIVGILGIIKAGGAYIPVDPTYPSERKAFMLQDSSVPVLLTKAQLVESFPQNQVQVVCLDYEWEKIADYSSENPASRTTPENLAYVIYTSGSTGKPKGVTVPHRSVNRLVINTNYISLKPLDVVAFASNFSFDAATFEIWGALINGARLVVITKDVALSPYEFAAQIHEQGISVLFLTTALFNLLVRVVPSAFHSVRYLLFGGEAVELKAVKEVLKNGSPERLLHVYGPTENTTFTTCYLVQDVPEEATTISIGRPIANTQVYLLDTQLHPVPIGVPGELYIGGDGLARGYLNRPDLTNEKFILNPFSNQPGNRLYKTGDLARYLPDGNIEYIGRIDNQVKIRGFRIEIGEIEAVLNQHPSVKETIIIAIEKGASNKQLVAYIIPQPETGPNISDLRHFLKQKLPNYMIPSGFVTLDNFPLTPNGKIDRRALPYPDLRPELELTFVAPRTSFEEILANIWSDVLGIQKIGIEDNFFELGGNSLLATQVISRIRNNLTIEIPLSQLFEAPTIAELAEGIQIFPKSEQSTQTPPLLPICRSTEIPLSFAQSRLWFLDKLQPESAFYNIPYVFQLHGQLNINVLENSLNEIIRRHEALRTNFTTQSGRPIQIIHSSLNLKLLITDLQNLSQEAREIEAQRLVTQSVIQPFNLEQEPLLRSSLLKLSEQDYIFVLILHHIIADGWSIRLVNRELSTIYAAYYNGQTPILPELPIQYADFAIWQRHWFSGEVLQKQLNYWQQQLKDIPTLLELPTDRPRSALQRYRGTYQSFQLPKDLSEAIILLSKRLGVTLFMTLYAAFQTLLYRYTGQDDIVVGTPIANRNRQEIERLIGFFVNTLVLRTDLSGNPSFEELLGRVREVALAAYAHQDMPFEELVEALQPQRTLSYTPLFQVMFALDNTLVYSMDLPDLRVSSYSVETGTAKFDLTLSMKNSASGLIGEWEYNTDLFDADRIARMAGHFQTLLEAIAANPKQAISELPLLTQPERQQLLVEWNNTFTEFPQDKCIYQLFQEQVERSPDSVAVVFENEQLTYRELNARANQLAHHLQSLGVEPEVLVGLCIERSLTMVVALLGILKAGGAYIPLDPAYPQQRLALMLCDAQVSILLTQASLVTKLPQLQIPVVCLDTDSQVIQQQPQNNPNSSVKPDNLAYILYTSGSTGKPKGVAITQRNTVAFLHWAQQVFTLEQLAGVLASTSINFDISVFELFLPLSCGGKVILVKNLLSLPSLATTQDITLINTPPSVIAEFLKVQGIPASVHTINLAGESLPNQLVQQIYQQETIKQVFNLYGPSEATTYCTYFLAQPGETKSPPIGRPINNTQIYILDSYLQPVPIGVPGELYIGGAGLAKGYLNRPELTKEKFIPHPFSNNESQECLYKTGDLARYLMDGNIEYLGRIDNQVKIRGLRIELGEIETALNQHPEVFQSLVIPRKDISGDQRLVAYIVSNQEQTLTISQLRSFLKQKLPDYMIPGAFILLNALPLTPNGKIDRRALPICDRSSIETQVAKVPPQNELERQLVKIWEKVLDSQSVGIHDNFFDLGGHSLLSVRLFAEIEQTLGVNLPLWTLLQVPTVEQLAHTIRQSESSVSSYSVNISQLHPDDYRKLLAIVAGRQGDRLKPDSLIVVLNPDGVKQPFLFCANSLEEVLPLAKSLGEQQPIWFLESGFFVIKHTEDQIKALAAHYVHELLTIQPEGNYLLGGYSFGSLVAYEIAKQLEEKGKSLSLLAILDRPGSEPIYDYYVSKIIPILVIIIHVLSGQLSLTDINNLKRIQVKIKSILYRLFSNSNHQNPKKLTSCIKNLQRPYRMQGYSGKIELFLATTYISQEQKLRALLFPRLGWYKRSVAQVHQIPGNHLDIIKEPYVKVLADRLTLLFRDFQKK